MKHMKLYTPENVERARYAQTAVAIVALAFCAYVSISTLLGVRQVRQTERALSKAVLESGTLSRKAAKLEKREASQARLTRGGVESFALQLSKWAKESGVDVDSLAPEGSPLTTNVQVGETQLGVWSVHKVRVSGRGDYPRVMSMLGRLRDPRMPVHLESMLIQTSDSGSDGVITFNLVCAVYEKKGEAS